MLRSEKIKEMLLERTFADLANQYHKGMEVQVNVSRAGGTRVEKERNGVKWAVWSNDDQTEEWKSYRIPRDADTSPIDNDVHIRFDHDKYVEGIGLTGWNYEKKESYFFGFDIDSIVNHRKGLTNTELQELREAAFNIPWVTVRRSTSGSGLHIYIHLDYPFPTENHVEHAALARSILSKMSAVTGYKFDPQVDVCGHVMWFWHQKMVDTDGLTLLKQGELFKMVNIPSNWRDHVQVITGKHRRTLPKTKDGQILKDLIGQKSHIGLDEQHIAAINWLEGSSSYWDMDNHILVTHTAMLKAMHVGHGLRGYFETNSSGKDCPNDINCFCFPMPNGAFAVYRFGQGIHEHKSWCQDGKGWTFTYLNRNPDLMTIARAYEAVENEKGWYLFREAALCKEAMQHLGVDFELPSHMVRRGARVKENRDGRIVIKIDTNAKEDNPAEMSAWEASKDASYTRLFNASKKAYEEQSYGTYDDNVRHLISPKGEDMGWVIKDSNNHWNDETLINVKLYMQSRGVKINEITFALGWAIDNPWRIVSRPFDSEYPGGRDWNRNAPQYAFHLIPPGTPLVHPTWDLVMNHLGAGLDEAVADDDWCKTNQITNGAHYLRLWVASMFQFPNQPTPYLFFYGEQNTGKSIFHEAISMLMTRGYVRADQAMRNPSDFNGELLNAVFCVIEETHLGRDKRAYAHLKDWVTAIHLSIHIKGETPFLLENMTHWCQFANEQDACPVFTGDKRITYISVSTLDKEIPKRVLLNKLREEAPHYLTAIVMRTEIPEASGRLNIPPITTSEMEEVQRSNESVLERFLRDYVYPTEGHMVLASKFHEEFLKYLRLGDPSEAAAWQSKGKLIREIPLAYARIFKTKFVRGRSSRDSNAAYGNMTFDEKAVPNGEYISDGKFLRLMGGTTPEEPVANAFDKLMETS